LLAHPLNSQLKCVLATPPNFTNIHAAGMNGAPKFQNNRDWAPIIKEGKVHVIAEAYNGVRKMPAKGGKPDLTLEDFSGALIYMVNASGGNWSDPTEQEYIKIKNKLSKLSSKK